MQRNESELLSVPDAAIAKGVHQETVRRAIRAGRLPALQIGRNYFVGSADLQLWQPQLEKAPVRRAASQTRGVASASPIDTPTDQPLVSGQRLAFGVPRVHNLSVPPTPLLGRESELEMVRTYLTTEGKRLVTLTGPGGAGKTRLALEAAFLLVDRFEYGVWFIDLASISDASLILPAIAQTLGLLAPRGRPVREVLIDWLRHRRLLIVLDNCEHLLAGMPDIATLLGACPELQVLATSRAALHLAGEHVLPLHPLNLPDLYGEFSAHAVRKSAAVTLFVERATAVDPTFELSDENARAVAEICVRLDGLPLAIELAAARVRVLAVEQIATRLDDRFRLLTPGPQSARPRQQSLRATVDWSYELLSEPERALLRRLSVFAGGWTLDAAEVVATGGAVEQDGMLDLMAQLVDKSLVTSEARSGVTRYRLHETIRQYVRERLRDAGEESDTRDRHLSYFLALAEEADVKLRGAEYQHYLDRLEEENANLRAALRWGLDPSRNGDAALRLCGALVWFWWLRSYVDEGRRWVRQALEMPAAHPPARLKALICDGYLAQIQSDTKAARQRFEECLALAHRLGDHWAEAWVLNNLGRAAYYDNDPAIARKLGEESLALAEKVGDDWLIAWGYHQIGLAAHIAGDFTTARSNYERSLEIRRALSYDLGMSIVLQLLGIVAIREGDFERACALHREGTGIARNVLGPWGFAMPLACLCHLAALLKQPRRAVRLGAASRALCEAYHTPLIPLFEPHIQKGLQLARQDLGDDAYWSAWADGQAMSLEESIADALAVESDSRPPVPGATASARSNVPFGSLTAAERQVLKLVSRGMTTREIAAELFVSASTIDRHLTHVYGKLGVRNRAEATAFALNNGLT